MFLLYLLAVALLFVTPACVCNACLRLAAPARGNYLHCLLAAPACCTCSQDGLVVHACGACLSA